jgi:hypothetical protein
MIVTATRRQITVKVHATAVNGGSQWYPSKVKGLPSRVPDGGPYRAARAGSQQLARNHQASLELCRLLALATLRVRRCFGTPHTGPPS